MLLQRFATVVEVAAVVLRFGGLREVASLQMVLAPTPLCCTKYGSATVAMPVPL